MKPRIGGVVKGGLIVPDAPLPERVRVEITLPLLPVEVPPELQAAFDDWDAVSAKALDAVEKLARGEKPDEPG